MLSIFLWAMMILAIILFVGIVFKNSGVTAISNEWSTVQLEEKLEMTSIEIETNSSDGSGNRIWLHVWKESFGWYHGYLGIEFSDPPKYLIYKCTGDNNDFTESFSNLPKDQEKVWKIAVSTSNLVINCNGIEVARYTYASSQYSWCKQWSETTAIELGRWSTAALRWRLPSNYEDYQYQDKGGDEIISPDCVDENELFCPLWATAGYCTTNSYVQQNCILSCSENCATQDQNISSDQDDNNVDEEDSSFENEILTVHNEYRAKHSTGSLTWSDECAHWAQNWANTLAAAGRIFVSTDMSRHSDRSDVGLGENIGWMCSSSKYADSSVAAETIVSNWYNEIDGWNFDTNSKMETGDRVPVTNHFTQLVWKSTTELGCGLAQGERYIKEKNYSCTWIVCDYSPNGNIVGTFERNVLPPQMK